MLRLSRAAVIALIVTTARGSGAAAQARPQDTEVWTPVPPIVTPGRTNADPPSDAVVLFDGRSIAEWVSAKDGSPARWSVADGVMTVVKAAGDIRTKRTFTNYQLHVEWRVPENVTGKDQERGNSGVYLGWSETGDFGYELQVLDSYQNTTYVNAMRKPGEWQTYDVVWTAPVFDANGAVSSPAYVTAFHNGVLVQNHVALRGDTKYIGKPEYRAHGPLPILLQAHGDPSPPLSFRNIWIRELK
jgi:hypothetical protein